MKTFASFAIAALAATTSALPLTTSTNDTPVSSGVFSIQIQAPGTEWDGKFLSINPATTQIAITNSSTSAATPQFQVLYPSDTDPNFSVHGQLLYTPQPSPEACHFWTCPPHAVAAGFDMKLQQPIEYVRDNMKAMLFTPPTSATELNTWKSVGVSFEGEITVDGESKWWGCPTEYPYGSGVLYESIWLADGEVSDQRCTQVSLKRYP